MSKDNREDLKCCGNCDHPEDSGDYCPYAGTNVFKHHICGNWKQYKPLNMDLRSKLGKVTIDSGNIICPICNNKGTYYQSNPDCATCGEVKHCEGAYGKTCSVESKCNCESIDSGAYVCEWWETSTKGLYDNGCGLPGFSLTNNPLCSFKYCPYCGKPITIKGE